MILKEGYPINTSHILHTDSKHDIQYRFGNRGVALIDHHHNTDSILAIITLTYTLLKINMDTLKNLIKMCADASPLCMPLLFTINVRRSCSSFSRQTGTNTIIGRSFTDSTAAEFAWKRRNGNH